MSIRSLSALFLGAGVLLVAGLTVPAAAPPRAAGTGLIARVYPVADLITPIDAPWRSGQTAEPGMTLPCRLIRLIQNALEPDSWASRGGVGTIDYYPLGMTLVVKQTPRIHEWLAGLLDGLRNMQDVEVSAEVRLVSIHEECLERLGISLGEGETMPGTVTLSEAELIDLLAKAQIDRRTNVMQAPKMTLFNGQRASLKVMDDQTFVIGVEWVTMGDRAVPRPKNRVVSTGLKLSLLPTVAPDHRNVTVQLGLEMAWLKSANVPVFPIAWALTPEEAGAAKPVVFTQFVQQPEVGTLSVDTTLKVPAGKTALLGGWPYEREVRHEHAAPLLCDLPYLGKLFRKVSYHKEKTRLLVLVTPRVCVPQEAQPEAMNEESPVAQVGAALGPVAGGLTGAAVVEPATPCAVQQEVKGQPRCTNRKSFELTYRLGDEARSRVHGIEVWYKQEGTCWKRYPNLVKPTGTVPITVEEEGRWAFSLVGRSEAGLVGKPPESGDVPHVWVEVDTTPPEVIVHPPVREGTGKESVIRFRWEARDRNLEEQMVSLDVAASPDGPWKTLAFCQPNCGTLTVPCHELPADFYTRIEARDRAGNVGVGLHPQPPAHGPGPRIRAVELKTAE